MKDHVYVRVLFESGRAVGHKIGPDPESLTKASDAELEEKKGEPPVGDNFETQFDQFAGVIEGYIDYMPLAIGIGQLLAPNYRDVIVPHLENSAKLHSEPEGDKIFELTIPQWIEFDALCSTIRRSKKAAKDLPRMMMMGLLASFDFHLLALFRIIAEKVPKAVFEADRKIAVSEIIAASGIDELKSRIIDSETDSISRKSFSDQMKWVKKSCNLEDIEGNFPKWNDLVEIIERRNLFVHNGGFVNDVYLTNVFGKKDVAGAPKLGDELHVDGDYYRKAVQVVSEFGITITQVIWRKIAPTQNKEADSSITDYTYRLIERGQYKSAIALIETALKFRNIATDNCRKILTINLANAKRLSGDESGANATLNEVDWSATSRKFKICVSAVKGDLDQVLSLMHQIGAEGDITREEYESWPVFYKLRDQERFVGVFQEIFGAVYRPSPEKRSNFGELISSLAIRLERSRSKPDSNIVTIDVSSSESMVEGDGAKMQS